MNRPIHFEIHAPDITRARDFYEKTFGWKLQKWPGPVEYWLATTGDEKAPGINGGLMPSRDGQARTINTVKVADVDEMARTVVRNGGKVVLEKMAIPGVGWLVYCTDPGGNIFGIMHDDPRAA